MKLKFRVTSLDEVPEAFHEAYEKQSDGSFTLSLDGVRDPEAVLRKNAELVEDLRKARGRLEKWEKLGDAEKAAEALQTVQELEEKRAKAEGNFEQLKTQMAERHAAEKAELMKTIDKLNGGIRKLVAETAAREAISSFGIKPGVLLPQVMSQLEVVEEGGEYVVRVVNGGYVKVADGAGTPMTVKQLVAEFKQHDDFKDVFPGPGSSGSGAPARTAAARGAASEERVTEIAVDSTETLLKNLEKIAGGQLKPIEG